MNPESALEKYFSVFRSNIIGNKQVFDSPFGKKEIIYADWTASGRAYLPIEEAIRNKIMPFLANIHTTATVTGTLMASAYEEAKAIVKKHVNADKDDVLIFCGSGMTAAVNKLQRILGLRIPERISDYDLINNRLLNEELKPVVFITHMEHHSNQTSWLETIATVEIIDMDESGNIDLLHFKSLLEKYKLCKHKIAAITACSNVTGIETPYHEIAKMIHQYGGLCFVDFACSAPYVNINMHPEEIEAYLDAIYFSPHKFLGGPGSSGVLIFNQQIYKNTVPDQPGGGTVTYTNPWKIQEYITNIEHREDGGTPPVLQGVKAAMCIKLKEQMGVENIQEREHELLAIVFNRLSEIKGIAVLADQAKKRLGVISFILTGAPYNLIVKILNDRFGIQTRGGCSCAGTYGHWLLGIDKKESYQILDSIRSGDLLSKPGWIRLSVHPTMTNAEIYFIMDAIEQTALHFNEWGKDYVYNTTTNEYAFNAISENEQQIVEDWFKI